MLHDLLASSLLAVLGLGGAVGAELLDSPSPENFLRRDAARATVIGNYVYVDGGEVSQLVDGSSDQWRASNQVNSTLSIDISKSWTTSDVVIRSILKPTSAKSNVALWTDKAAGVFYSWGGKFPFGANMIKNALWKFTPDGSGGGAWSQEEPTNPALFNALHPSEYGAFAYTNDTGILIGGLATGWTEQYRAKTQTLPGMVTYNMKTKVWQNGTTNFSPFNTLAQASAHFVPSFGDHGLVLVLGGHTPAVVGEPDIPTTPFHNLQNLTLFDPETKKTYWQIATGSIPPSPRSFFCTTGYQTPNGGYDVFIFGGQNRRDQFNYEDAYILSLPGFVWTRVPDMPAGRRQGAGCVPVGKRQILTIGGADGQWKAADPAPQGLLVFDMTAMKWKDSYDASAAAYESADDLKNWYNNGSLEKVEWSSDEVRKIFATESTNSPNPTSGATDGTNTNTNTGTSSDTNSGSTTDTSSTPVGAIVGGVVGGIAGLAAIAVLAWLLIRRRNKNRNYAPAEASELQASDENYRDGGGAYYASSPKPPVEKAATPERVELGASDYRELYSQPDTQQNTPGPVEMDGTPVSSGWR